MEYCLEMTNYQLSISLLQDFSVLKAFDCGIEAMNKFIRNDFQITVEAYATNDYSAVDFYINCGFSPSELKNPNKDTLRMFMTLYSKE